MTKVLILLGESGLVSPSIPSLEKHFVGEDNTSSWSGAEAGADRPDPSLTATSGGAAIAEGVDKLDAVGIFDRGIGSIKDRSRGATAGELLVGLAQSQLLGGGALVGLDRQCADVAAVELSVVPVLASTTAAGLARRFGPDQLAGVQSAVAPAAPEQRLAHALVARAYRLLPDRRQAVLDTAVTIDMDCTDVQVNGPKKGGVAYNNAADVRTWPRGPRRA